MILAVLSTMKKTKNYAFSLAWTGLLGFLQWISMIMQMEKILKNDNKTTFYYTSLMLDDKLEGKQTTFVKKTTLMQSGRQPTTTVL